MEGELIVNLELRYGVLCDKLENQLKEQGYIDSKIDIHENIRESINMLYIKDYITDRQKDTLFKKLNKDIIKNIKLI